MIAKENGKADVLKWLKRKFLWQRIGELYLNDFKVGFPLYYEPIKQADGTKKMQVVAWCEPVNITLKDIVLSNETIRSVELVEAAKPMSNMLWTKNDLIWKVNVYNIKLMVASDLVDKPTLMSATLRIAADARCQRIFSYMGIQTDCPIADGPVAYRFE